MRRHLAHCYHPSVLFAFPCFVVASAPKISMSTWSAFSGLCDWLQCERTSRVVLTGQSTLAATKTMTAAWTWSLVPQLAPLRRVERVLALSPRVSMKSGH